MFSFDAGSGYLWTKLIHIWFVISWFAGLFYLPRILVNIALVDQAQAQSEQERLRLLRMADKLYRFMLPLAVITVISGLCLWLYFGFSGVWLHIKTTLVFGLLCYHVGCGMLLKKCHQGVCPRSDRWLRWFNEIPVMILLVVLALVLFKPQAG